jgi:hypothetical protein
MPFKRIYRVYLKCLDKTQVWSIHIQKKFIQTYVLKWVVLMFNWKYHIMSQVLPTHAITLLKVNSFVKMRAF